MQITLSPIASNRTTEVSLNGLILTVDGVDLNLSLIPVGGQAESDNEYLVGIVTRDAVTVQYHYDSVLAEPMQSTDINDYIVNITDGVVPSPIVWRDTNV